jgi:hypothetical protein
MPAQTRGGLNHSRTACDRRSKIGQAQNLRQNIQSLTICVLRVHHPDICV